MRSGSIVQSKSNLREVWQFYMVTLTISWAIWVPSILYYTLTHSPKIPPWLFVLGWLGVYGPTTSALIMTWRGERTRGVRNLLSRLLSWRVRARWYILVFLIPLTIRFFGLLLYSFVNRTPLGFDSSRLLLVIPTFLLAIPFGPMGEETGWRGYALPRLQASLGDLHGSLALGLLWVVWHIPGFFIPGLVLPPVPLEWHVVLNFLIRVFAITFVFTWVYNRTGGSLLISVLFHAAFNALPGSLTLILFGQPTVADTNWLTWLSAGINWLLVALLLYIERSHKTREQED